LNDVRLDLDDQNTDEYQEMLNQIVIDVFSFVASKISFDLDGGSDLTVQLVEQVLQRFDLHDDWQCQKWIKFVTILLVCNGGSPSGASGLEFEETV
jgi:hypothetical protein